MRPCVKCGATDRYETSGKCRPCAQARAKRYQEENKDLVRERNLAYSRANSGAHYEKRRARLYALKDYPCFDCGVQYPPAVMEFDHVRGVKSFEIGISEMGRKDLAEEIMKCDLRCANCHRLRHIRDGR
jgi:hypothetical protein